MNESDILFENIYTDTPETVEALYKHLYARNRKIYTWIFGGMAVVLLLAFLLLDLAFLVPFLLTLFYLLYFRRLHKRIARQRRKDILNFYDGAMPQQILRFTGDTLYYICGYSSLCLPLRKLTRFSDQKHGLVLQAGNQFHALLLKDAFTKGTYEDFLEFLKEKCPSVNTKK